MQGIHTCTLLASNLVNLAFQVVEIGNLMVYCNLKPMLSIVLKVASSNTSPLESHAAFFRLLMKGIFDPYVL